MLREMRPSEFGIWASLWRAEPWDEVRADLRAAQIALQVSRSGLKKSSGDWSITDFMPSYKPPKPEGDKEKLLKQFGSRVVKKGKDK